MILSVRSVRRVFRSLNKGPKNSNEQSSCAPNIISWGIPKVTHLWVLSLTGHSTTMCISNTSLSLLKSEGNGTKLLEAFVHSVSKTVLLEIDPIVDAISEAHLRFYERCGFHQNPYPHTHPPYREGYESHPLVVLTSGRRIAEDEYHRFKSDLETVVMA